MKDTWLAVLCGTLGALSVLVSILLVCAFALWCCSLLTLVQGIPQ